MKYFKHFLLFITLSLFAACNSGPAQDRPFSAKPIKMAQQSILPIMPEEIFNGKQCNVSKGPAALWIESPQALERFYKQVNRTKIGAGVKLPFVDFINNGVLLISMGDQRTGGYSVSLQNSALTLDGQRAELKVQWKTPSKGMMLIQMLTSPCMLVKVPKGDYSSLNVVDQNNHVQVSISLD